jgi:large subunit ribosomal protein L25
MIQKDLAATVRTVYGKGEMRRLRTANLTPGVVYGAGGVSTALQFDSGDIYKQLLEIHGRNAVVNLHVEGDAKATRHVLVRELQKEPVNDSLVHVDFQEIDLDKPRTFKVPINYTGTAKGGEFGGDMQIMRTELTLTGRPLDVPDTIDVDVTPLVQDGPGITLGEMPLPEGVTMLDQADRIGVIVR